MPEWIKSAIGPVVGAIMTGLTAAVKHLWSKQKAQEAAQKAEKEARDKAQKAEKEARDKEMNSLRDGMLALMHDRIFAIYAECTRKKFASVEDIRNLEYLYRPYHALGGNGTGTELYERVKKMPTEPPAMTA